MLPDRRATERHELADLVGQLRAQRAQLAELADTIDADIDEACAMIDPGRTDEAHQNLVEMLETGVHVVGYVRDAIREVDQQYDGLL